MKIKPPKTRKINCETRPVDVEKAIKELGAEESPININTSRGYNLYNFVQEQRAKTTVIFKSRSIGLSSAPEVIEKWRKFYNVK